MDPDTPNQQPHTKMDRRDFLRLGLRWGAVGAGAASGMIVVAAGPLIYEGEKLVRTGTLRVRDELRDEFRLPQERQEALLKLFATQGETLLVAGMHNPFEEGLHPDDVLTLDRVKDVFTAQNVSREAAIPYDEDAHLLCLGSPQSNIDSLYHLWFERLPDGSVHLSKDSPYSLPFEYLFPPLDAPENEKAIQRWVGDHLSKRPPYYVKLNVPVPDHKVSEITSLADGEGWLAEDWLVVSKVPHRDAPGKFVIVAGGMHGTGTKAFAQLVHELDIGQIAEMDQQRESHPYFQSLFHIPKVEHKPGLTGKMVSMPVGLEHVLTYPIVVHPNRI